MWSYLAIIWCYPRGYPTVIGIVENFFRVISVVCLFVCACIPTKLMFLPSFLFLSLIFVSIRSPLSFL